MIPQPVWHANFRSLSLGPVTFWFFQNEILYEAAKVLRYPRFQKFHKLTEQGIYQYIAFLRQVSEMVRLDPTLTVPIRDVNDLIVAQTAILGEADIPYHGRGLYDTPAHHFLARFGITVMSEVELIYRIGKESFEAKS